MKYLIIALCLFLCACDLPAPMSESESSAFNRCLQDKKIPHFYAHSNIRELTCNEPKKEYID